MLENVKKKAVRTVNLPTQKVAVEWVFGIRPQQVVEQPRTMFFDPPGFKNWVSGQKFPPSFWNSCNPIKKVTPQKSQLFDVKSRHPRIRHPGCPEFVIRGGELILDPTQSHDMVRCLKNAPPIDISSPLFWKWTLFDDMFWSPDSNPTPRCVFPHEGRIRFVTS